MSELFGARLHELPEDPATPPSLYVVVDTEAEFDWTQPFARDLTSIRATAALPTAQAIFDRYDIRPIYLIDYPIATQPESVAVLRAILDRGGCELGAHLHPWTNPPFGEALGEFFSYPGNLPEAAEASKLDALLDAIETSFGVRPIFYKAGRYGIGPNTARLVAARGMTVDFSLLPETDLSAHHGPDFRRIRAAAYRIGETGLITVAMTRAHVGPLARRQGLVRALDGRAARALHLRGALAKTGLLDRLTLTPEGFTAAQQIRLIQALIARGRRRFVLHYHSPSLAPGHTPYVRDEAERVEFLARIERVCGWFINELGGRAGEPKETVLF